MLFKWIVLIVIAWYVFRAAGNLIAAARGGQPPIDNGRPHAARPQASGNQGEGPSIRVVRKPGSASSASRREEDVEDARFTDL